LVEPTTGNIYLYKGGNIERLNEQILEDPDRVKTNNTGYTALNKYDCVNVLDYLEIAAPQDPLTNQVIYFFGIDDINLPAIESSSLY
jgi:hypothetical protein